MRTTWNAFPVLDRFLDDVMNGASGTAFGTTATQGAFDLAVDVRANEEEIVVLCDVPGLKREELEVTLEAGKLTIKGERRYVGGEKDRVWLGRRYGRFTKVFTLPEHVDAEAMTAELVDGVLTLRVPKKAVARPRRIAIGGAPNGQLTGEKY
jgi:HSP20 family protein